MANAYRIKRFSHVADAKRRRLLEEDLVPILDDSGEQETDIRGNDIQNLISEGDWLIEYRDQDKPLYIYQVKSYRHEPRLHLYVKHFVEIEHIYKMESAYIPDETHLLLAGADHLEALPPHILDTVNEFDKKVTADFDEKFKQLMFKLRLRRNVLSQLGRSVLIELESGKLSETRLKDILQSVTPEQFDSVRAMIPEVTDAEWELVKDQVRIFQWDNRVEKLFKTEDAETVKDANDSVREKPASPVPPGKEIIDPEKVTGAISKAALETYQKKHDGRLPTVEEFEKLTKRFSTPGTRRRSRN